MFSDCGGIITGVSGDFASPGWPRNYTHHLNCTWTVRVPEHKVRVLFGDDVWLLTLLTQLPSFADKEQFLATVKALGPFHLCENSSVDISHEKIGLKEGSGSSNILARLWSGFCLRITSGPHKGEGIFTN